MKIYIILREEAQEYYMGEGEAPVSTYVDCVFKDKISAEKYIKQMKIENRYGYYRLEYSEILE